MEIHTLVSAPLQFNQNAYVVWLPERTDAVVIDPGLEPELILDFLRDQRPDRWPRSSTRTATPTTSPATRR